MNKSEFLNMQMQEHCKHKFEYLGNDIYRCKFCGCLTSGRGQR